MSARFAVIAVLSMSSLGAGARAAELKAGDVAPDFALAASDGKTYRLSDFKGKKAVVLAWFPRAFTSGCTIECRSLAANGEKIRRYDVAYFMASVDAVDGEKGNKAFAAAEKADFPVLSDPTKETATAYGVLHPERGVAQRWTFYVDRDGKIAATSAEDMMARLEETGIAKPR
jgi:peroxiredoxin Q/BCP